MVQKIVINNCYGGFGLSELAINRLKELGYPTDEAGNINYYDIPRDDSLLVRVVEELGDLANDSYARLKIVEIPDDTEWVIKEYDGNEWVAEKHRTWE